MSSKYAKDQEPIPYQALVDKNQSLSDENRALKGEIESLRARLEEAEELKRAISEGDLDALIIPGPERELIFTLDSADRAYRVLVETMNEGTATLAYDGTILYCNRRFAELLGVPSQSIVGISIYQFIESESIVNFNACLKHKMNTGEINLKTKDGSSLPVLLSISSLKAEGSPNAWCLVVTDLTEQKKNEEILASERLTRSIIEQSAETIIVCDTSGRITHFSNSMRRLCGCDPKFQRFENLINLRASEGEDEGKSVLPISGSLKGSTILGMEATFESENHQKFHLLLNSAPLKNDNGEIVGCVTTLTDITERKRMEETSQIHRQLLETVVNNIPVAVNLMRGSDLAIELVNPAYQTIGPGKEMIGKTLNELWPETQRDFIDLCNQVLVTGKPYYETDELYMISRFPSCPLEPAYFTWSLFRVDLPEGKGKGILNIAWETTERKRLETALKRNEQRLSDILSSIQDGLFELDQDWRFTYINQRAALNGGFEPGELIGKSIWEKFPYMANSKFEYIYRQVMETRIPANFEIKSLIRDQWYGVSVYPSTSGISAFWRDVTDSKQAEKVRNQLLQDIDEQRARLQAIIDSMPVGLWITDSNGKMVFTNSIAHAIWGGEAPYAENVEKNYRAYKAWWSDTGKPIPAEDMPIARSLRGETIREIAVDFERFDGTLGTQLVSSAPIQTSDGKITGSVAIVQDITYLKRIEEELKRARDTLEEKVKERTDELEEAYNSLLENEMRLSESQKIAHLGNWDWNLLTDELYWSDEIYKIFRLDPLELVPTYNEFLSYIHLEDRNRVNSATQRALKGDLFNIEYRINLDDGEKRIVYSQGEVIFDEKGIPIRMRGIIQDITERKMAEEALEKIDKIRIKEIHHRIKNNLQVISSLLDLQVEKFEDEKVREAFKEGQNRVISMSLIHEELYKGEGTDTLDFSVYLQKLAESLFQTYSLNSKNIRLRTDLEESALLDMDIAVPLGIIVNELVSNSLKHAFTENKEGEIRIQLCREEKNSEMRKALFSLTVSDNGKGIPENIELESVESLGLQLVSILVDQLDGEIELKRMQGTEFRITFSVEKNLYLSIN